LSSAALFDAPAFKRKHLNPSPFLLPHLINFGLAIASAALLVYSPFAQRSIVLMCVCRKESQTPKPAH